MCAQRLEPLPLTSLRRLGTALFFLVAAALSICKIRSFDPPWVVAAGETTLRLRQLVEHDPFSYTSQQPWMHHEWLTEVSWALAYRLGGWTLTCLLAGALVALTVFIVYSTRPGWMALLPCAVLVAGLRETSDPVAQLFSDVLFAATLKLLIDDERGTGLPRRRLALALLGLQLLWTQLHGGNPTGVTLLGVWFLARPSVYRAALTAGAALLTCAGPYGARVHGHFFAHHGSISFIQEFQPLKAALNAGSPLHIVFVVWVVLAIVALVVRARRGEQVRFEALALLVFLGVTVLYVRIATETAILATVTIASALRPSDRTWILPAAIALVVACVLPSARRFGFGLDPARYPLQAIGWLQREKPRGPMFNAYNYGGILLKDFPEEKVFIDGRAFITYSEQQLLELIDVYEHPDHFAALDARYHFRLVVLPLAGRSATLVGWLRASGAWQSAFSDGLAAVLVRR